MNDSVWATSVPFVYCGSGVLMVLLNKAVMASFPHPNLLLLTQTASAALVLAACSWAYVVPRLPRMTLGLARSWAPLSMAFSLALVSSMFALMRTGVTAVAVVGVLSVVSVAFVERVFSGTRHGSASVLSLVGVVVGVAIFAVSDRSFDAAGYGWLGLYVAAATAYRTHGKSVMLKFSRNTLPGGGDAEAMSATSMAFLTCILSVPVFVVTAAFNGELAHARELFFGGSSISTAIAAEVVATWVLLCAVSASAAQLIKSNSASKMAVANVVGRVAVIALSELVFERTLGPLSLAGAAVTVSFSWMHFRCGHAASIAEFVRSRKWRSVFLAVALSSLAIYGILSDSASRRVVVPAVSAKESSSSIGGRHVAPLVSSSSPSLPQPAPKPRGAPFEVFDFESFLPRQPRRSAVELKPGITIADATVDFNVAVDKKCNVAMREWNTCDPKACPSNNNSWKSTAPMATAWGEASPDFVDRVLRKAWGPSPPSVDLYLRTTCAAKHFTVFLFESIELYWPRFLGDIIVVFDVNDRPLVEELLPRNPKHHYRAVFEHCPCMSGRIFNQYSYLNLDVHTTADWVVTIDSDCSFHTPVTPDLVFRNGRILQPRSHDLQQNNWNTEVEYFTGRGTFKWHTMVQQPVNYHVSSFAAYRKWFTEAHGGKCLPERIAEFSRELPAKGNFCWMCQLSTFINTTGLTADKYDFYDCDDKNDRYPYMRYTIHFKHEPPAGPFADRVDRTMNEGLCRAFGEVVFPSCAGKDTKYVDDASFVYCGWWPFSAAPASLKASVRSWYVRRVRAISDEIAKHHK